MQPSEARSVQEGGSGQGADEQRGERSSRGATPAVPAGDGTSLEHDKRGRERSTPGVTQPRSTRQGWEEPELHRQDVPAPAHPAPPGDIPSFLPNNNQ